MISMACVLTMPAVLAVDTTTQPGCVPIAVEQRDCPVLLPTVAQRRTEAHDLMRHKVYAEYLVSDATIGECKLDEGGDVYCM